MKKILIICDFFPPDTAPRMGYLCKYLPELGWEPVIIAEKVNQNLFPALIGNQAVRYVNFYPDKNKYVRKLKRFFTVIADFLFSYKDSVFTKLALQETKQHHFDLILTSSYRTFPLKAAYNVSRKKNIPLVVDLRDIMEQAMGSEFIHDKLSGNKYLNNLIIPVYRKKLLSLRNKVLRYAQHVTTISEWHVQMLKQYNNKVDLIYNGFDTELFYPVEKKTHQFKIVYTGKLINLEMRDPTMLFEAVADLSKKGILNSESCRIQFFTDNKSKHLVDKIAREFSVEEYVDYFDMVPSNLVPDILNESSVLLLLTNKSDTGPKGIMTTKFFEYLAVEKPILCVRSDEDCLEKAIGEAQAGLAARETGDVVRFLAEKYEEWKHNGLTTIVLDKTDIQKYKRDYQAKQFVKIFESLI